MAWRHDTMGKMNSLMARIGMARGWANDEEREKWLFEAEFQRERCVALDGKYHTQFDGSAKFLRDKYYELDHFLMAGRSDRKLPLGAAHTAVNYLNELASLDRQFHDSGLYQRENLEFITEKFYDCIGQGIARLKLDEFLDSLPSSYEEFRNGYLER